jgi:hypothetical protein
VVAQRFSFFHGISRSLRHLFYVADRFVTTSGGVPGSVKRQRAAVKERKRGHDEAAFVESFVILNAARRECVDDFAYPRSDSGLPEL